MTRRRRGRRGPGGRFRRQPHTRARGAVGEDEAVRWLEARGYRVLERNYTCRGGEIDLVALDGEVLAFVEIKARAGRSHGRSVEGVSRTQLRRIVRAARWYLVKNPSERPCRFDVLGLDLETDDEARAGPGEWKFTLLRDAFRLDDS